jgi:hypothetical protein
MRKTIGAEHYGEERAQTAQAMAEQIMAAELKRRRWNEAAQDATQGGSGKGGVSGPAAGGDYDDGGLDRRTPGDGQSGLPESLALSPEEIRPEVAIIKNRP